MYSHSNQLRKYLCNRIANSSPRHLWKGVRGEVLSLSLNLIIILNLNLNLNAQSITVEPLSDCINSIITYHRAAEQTELKALDVYKEKKWYNMLPQPGIGYNMIANKPLLTLSMPDFISYINRRKDLKYRKHNTEVQTQNDINRDTISFKSVYRQLKELIEVYEKEKSLLSSDSILVSIRKEENKKLQATTEDVIKAEAALEQKKLSHRQSLQAILSKAASLETYLHRNFQISFE